MEHTALPALSAWESFYVIVGSSAAALTGLQFVVIVLAADRGAARSEETTRAFATPTIVHFCAVLLIAVLLSAPWSSLVGPAAGLTMSGLIGVVYEIIVIRTARLQKDYSAVFEDWLWHCALPLISYATLFVSAITLYTHPTTSLFVIGACSVLLLITGIHNAWDSVTYLALQRVEKAGD